MCPVPPGEASPGISGVLVQPNVNRSGYLSFSLGAIGVIFLQSRDQIFINASCARSGFLALKNIGQQCCLIYAGVSVANGI
jgi:hypothetical protein